MPAKRPASIAIEGFGRASVHWAPEPDADAVSLAVTAYIHHRIAVHLRQGGFTAKQLSAEVGGARTSWTNKLNGLRPFSVEDLAVLGFGVDPSLWNALPHDVASPGDLLPPEYVPLLSRQDLGHGMPQFLTGDLAQAAAHLTDWWHEEVLAGRGWALTLDVARQQAALVLDRLGLPSAEATVGSGSDRLRTVEWTARSTRLRILWLWPQQSDSLGVAEALRAVGDLVWAQSARPRLTRDIVVIGAPPTVVRNLGTALGFRSEDPPDSTTLSLQAAHGLGLAQVGSALPDHVVTIHGWEAESPLWLEIKT